MLVPMNQTRSFARRAIAVLAAILLSITLIGCGKKSDDYEEPAPEETTPAAAPVWPMTGLPQANEPNHPVMIVKIPNTSQARPQEGMDKADMVTEELVEGGITRLAVVFDSKVPEEVGPVRSMRASDIGIAKPANAVVVSSGAAPPTIARFNRAQVKFYDEGAEGMYRTSSRVPPYNLMVNLKEFNQAHKLRRGHPQSYLPWGDAAEFQGTAPATKIQAQMSTFRTSDFEFRQGKYINTNGYTNAGAEFKADNVLVMRVRVGDAGYYDPTGAPVPETIYKGTGNMALFHNGQVVQGKWQKDGLDSMPQLTDAAGAEVKVPAGKTFILLVPVQPKGGNLNFQP
jgi:hypothetical protein